MWRDADISGPGLWLWAGGADDSSPLPAADATDEPTNTTRIAIATATAPPLLLQLSTQIPEILRHPLHNIETWKQSAQSQNSEPWNETSNAPQALAHAAVAAAVVTVNPAVEKFAGLHGHWEETRSRHWKNHSLSVLYLSANVLTGPWEGETEFAPSRWSLLHPPWLSAETTGAVTGHGFEVLYVIGVLHREWRKDIIIVFLYVWITDILGVHISRICTTTPPAYVCYPLRYLFVQNIGLRYAIFKL